MNVPDLLQQDEFLRVEGCPFCTREKTNNGWHVEHVVPSYLGGIWKLIPGSCRSCARHSNEYYEGSVSNTSFYGLRVFLELDSRKRSSKTYRKVALGNQMNSDRDKFIVDLGEKRPKVFTWIMLFPPIPLRLEQPSVGSVEHIQIAYLNFEEYPIKVESSYGQRPRKSKKFLRDITAVRTYISKRFRYNYR